MNTVSRSELKAKYGKEYVLVVLNEDFTDFPEGFSLQPTEVMNDLASEGVFAPRYLVEHNPVVRQPIPYILLRQGENYFAMTRLSGSGEDRLHGLTSLGVGGHVNPVDASDEKVFFRALIRELFEEVSIELIGDSDVEANFVGIINDNSNDVSRDHIGLVFIVNVPAGANITVLEKDKYRGSFKTIDELIDMKDNLESWSKVIVDTLLKERTEVLKRLISKGDW